MFRILYSGYRCLKPPTNALIWSDILIKINRVFFNLSHRFIILIVMLSMKKGFSSQIALETLQIEVCVHKDLDRYLF